MEKCGEYISKTMEYGKMSDMNVSLICTLKNEEYSIKEFLDSLLSQSRPPDEIIIVDGGSTDGTVDIIRSYIEEGAPIKLIIKDGANIAQGRNIAIKNAKYDIIASTDAGCRVDKDWLKNLIRPFEDDTSVDVVSGWYEADARIEFEEYLAELTHSKLKEVMKRPEKFLPSSRSVAYKKKCWAKVRGYPEWLYTAEDTLFDLNLKNVGCKFTFAKDALVYWRERSNLRSMFKQRYLYAKGNAQAGLFTANYIKLFVLYLIFSISLLLSIVYHFIIVLPLFIVLWHFLKPIVSMPKKLLKLQAFFYIPLIIMLIDIALLIGFIRTYLTCNSFENKGREII